MSRPNISVPRQPARSVNEIRQKSSFIDTTVYDKLYGIRQDYDLLCGIRASRQCPTGVKAAKKNSDGNARLDGSEPFQSIIQMSQTVIRAEMLVSMRWEIL